MRDEEFDDDNDPEWKLVFAFPDQTESFANGFTCGKVWEAMRRSQTNVELLVPANARQTIEAMCMATGWIEEFKDCGTGGWLKAILHKPKAIT
jgi:hypothetical protein